MGHDYSTLKRHAYVCPDRHSSPLLLQDHHQILRLHAEDGARLGDHRVHRRDLRRPRVVHAELRAELAEVALPARESHDALVLEASLGQVDAQPRAVAVGAVGEAPMMSVMMW